MDLRVSSALGSLADQWDDLAAAAEQHTAFLSTWWLSQVTEGRPLYVLLVDGSTLVGGVALQEGPWWGLRRVSLRGSGPLEPDHLDIVAAAGMHDEVADRVVHWLVRPGPRVVDLEGLDRDSHLAAALGRRGLPVVEHAVAPFARLDGDVAGYLASRPTSLRRDLRRAERTMAKYGNTFRMARSGEDVRVSLRSLLALHAEQFAGMSRVPMAQGSLERAVSSGARRGHVAIGEVVSATGQVLAAQLILRSGTRIEHYQGGRRDAPEARGAGTWLLSRILMENSDADELDLLRGGEEYKDRWKTGQRTLTRCRVGVGPRAALLVRASSLRAAVAAEIESRRGSS